MKMSRASLINSTAMRHDGIMYSDAGTGGAPAGGPAMNGARPPPPGTQTPRVDNAGGEGGGNTQPNGGGSQTHDNTGATFDGKSFWNKPEPSPGESSSQGSADKSGGGSGTTATPQQEIATRLQNLSYSDVFTPEITEQVAKGDLTGINKAISSQMVQATQQAVAMSAQIMKLVSEKIMGDVDSRINGAFGNRDNVDSLAKSFPSYNDPGMKPVIDGVFNQAMTLSKGDRDAAIKSTREMLKYMGKSGAQDLGINDPPSGSNDSFSSARAQSLVDELLGRS